jgi:uncharacterized membrane protein YheB (UPF0754 family)
MDYITFILPWLLPPLIGAVIGYITNAVAITMLFRPHNEKRLFSVRLPMTPGIIPKQRYELSESVGKMVSNELLTEDAVRKQIRSKSFHDSIDISIRTFLDLIIDTPLSDLKDQFLKSKLQISTVSENEKSFLPELFNNFLRSKGVYTILDKLLDKGIGYLEGKTPNQLFPDKKDRIIEKLVNIVLSKNLEQRFQVIVDKWLEKAVHDNYHVSIILTEKNINTLLNVTQKLYIRLFPHFIHFLNTRDVKQELEVHGRRLLEDIINKLNKIQRFLVSAGQYDRTLDNNMADIVTDTINNLKRYGENEKNIDNMSKGLERRLVSLSQKTAGQVITEWDGDLFEDLHSLENSVFEFIRNPVVSENIKNWLLAYYNKYENITVKDLLSDWFLLTLEDLKKRFLNILFPDNVVKERNYSEKISNFFNIISNNGHFAVREIFNILPEVRTRISSSLRSTLIGIVDTKVPQILESIDINTLVVDKINTLDMAKVEKLILDIVRKQLRWINIFGAVLGSIIGAAQLLLNMFM